MAAPEAKVDLVSLLSQQKEGIVKDLILNDPKLVTKVQVSKKNHEIITYKIALCIRNYESKFFLNNFLRFLGHFHQLNCNF